MYKFSKGYRSFSGRLGLFQVDLETVEFLYKNREQLAGSGAVSEGENKTMEPVLSDKLCTPFARTAAIGHLRNTLYVSIIKELYEEVLLYCSYISECASMMAPLANRLVGEQNCTFTANDILSKTTREEINKMVISEVFRKIENKKNTLLLVSAVNERLELGVSEETLQNALPYLEARHKFVHDDGLADEQFKEKYPNVKLDKKGYIKLDKTIMDKVFGLMLQLVREYDERMTANGLFPPGELE